MKWTPEQVEQLTAMCTAEKSNAAIAEHFGVPVTEIHAKRSQLGITIPKVAAMKGNPALTVDPVFEAAVQEMEAGQMSPSGETAPKLTTEQMKKLLAAIFADTEDKPDEDSSDEEPDEESADEEPENDNYPETVADKVGYSEFVLSNALQYIGRAINRLSRLHRLLIISEHGETGKLPDIITHNELRMALEPISHIKYVVKDVLDLLMPIYRATKPEDKKP